MNNDSIRQLERASIREFVESSTDYMIGRVLDFGCGQQPYRDIVVGAGAEYCPYDRADFPSSISDGDIGDLDSMFPVQTVLCNQVVQYLHPIELTAWLATMASTLRYPIVPEGRGHLILTYPTCWDEVEPADLVRYTRNGMELLVKQAGFRIVRHERRAELNLGGFRVPLGYGLIARA